MISNLAPQQIPENAWKTYGFRALFLFEVHKDDIWHGETLTGVLLEERKLNISK